MGRFSSFVFFVFLMDVSATPNECHRCHRRHLLDPQDASVSDRLEHLGLEMRFVLDTLKLQARRNGNEEVDPEVARISDAYTTAVIAQAMVTRKRTVLPRYAERGALWCGEGVRPVDMAAACIALELRTHPFFATLSPVENPCADSLDRPYEYAWHRTRSRHGDGEHCVINVSRGARTAAALQSNVHALHVW